MTLPSGSSVGRTKLLSKAFTAPPEEKLDRMSHTLAPVLLGSTVRWKKTLFSGLNHALDSSGDLQLRIKGSRLTSHHGSIKGLLFAHLLSLNA